MYKKALPGKALGLGPVVRVVFFEENVFLQALGQGQECQEHRASQSHPPHASANRQPAQVLQTPGVSCKHTRTLSDPLSLVRGR